MSLDLGIKADLVAKAGIPINPPLPLDKPNMYFKSHIFPIATLEKVFFDPKSKSEDKQTGEVTYQPVLKFIYKDVVNLEKKITKTYYVIDMAGDDKAATKLDGMQKSIKHIYEELIGAENFIESEFEGKSFEELFANVQKAFEKHTAIRMIKSTKEGEEDTPETFFKYTTIQFYLKLIYFNGRLEPPMFPNFLQVAYKHKNKQWTQEVCELGIGKKDTIVNKGDATPKAGVGGTRDNNFGAGSMPFGMDMNGAAAADMVFPQD